MHVDQDETEESEVAVGPKVGGAKAACHSVALWMGKAVAVLAWFLLLVCYQTFVCSRAPFNLLSRLDLLQSRGAWYLLVVTISSAYGVIAMVASARVLNRMGVSGHFVAISSMIGVGVLFWSVGLLTEADDAWLVVVCPMATAGVYWAALRSQVKRSRRDRVLGGSESSS